MDREQAVKYLQSSGFSDEQIKAIEGAFTCDKCVYSTSEGCQYDDITETIPPFDDCISRQAVLDSIHANCVYENEYNLTAKHIEDAVKQLPPVNPQKSCKDCQYKEWLEGEDCPAYEKKTGRWILARTFPTKLYDEYLKEYECSECYRRIRCTESQLINYPYCHCGAKMVEPLERSGEE